MAAALSEGSANDWLSLAVVDGFDQPEAVGGGDARCVRRRHDPRPAARHAPDRPVRPRRRPARVSGVVSIVGLLLFGFAPTLALAGVGIVLWGFGAALAVPVGIAAASDDPMRAAGRVAVVSSFASVASIAAPPLLGIAAASTGARHALVLIAVAMVASVLLARPGRAGACRRSRTPPERHDDDEPLAHVADADPDPYAAIVARHADHVTARTRRIRAPPTPCACPDHETDDIMSTGGPMTTPAGHDDELTTRARPDASRGRSSGRPIAVFAVFFLNGFNFATWAARLPAIRDGLDFSPAQMGAAAARRRRRLARRAAAVRHGRRAARRRAARCSRSRA